MPRLHIPTFAEGNDGTLYCARGDRNIQRWDGLAAAWIDAGLTAPVNAVTMGTTSTGLIYGNLYAYQRYVALDGRVSNLSPVSTELVIAGVTKTITNVTNATPIVITTSASHGFSTNNRVKISGVIGTRSANGIWLVTNITATTFSLQNSSGNGTYMGGGTVRQGVSQIDYSNLGDASSDTRIYKRQILRNKDGNVNVFYVDKELTNLATTTSSSTNDEDDLGEAVVLLGVNGEDLNVTRHAEPPNYKKVIINHYSRLFAVVDAPYKWGGVAVTNASTTVTGINTAFTSVMAGWELFVNGDATTSYTVSSVNTSAQTLTLDTAYGGTTDPFALYELRPARSATGLDSREERRTLYYSESGLPESFNLNKGVTLSEDHEAGEMTGLMPIQTRLYVLFENRIYRLAYSNEPADGDSVEASWRGCVNQRSWSIVEESAYIMDRQGIYIFAGNYYEPISDAIQPLFERDTKAKYQINWNHQENFFSVHDPRTETIRWFISLGCERFPRWALRYHYRIKQWCLEEYPFAVSCGALGDLSGVPQLYCGATARRILALGHGHLDGIPNSTLGTIRGTATASTILSISDSTASFASDSVGFPVQITSGTGAGQVRIISSATATKLTLVEPWATLPDTTSKYQVGGIRWKYRTGWFRFLQSGQREVRGMELMIRPTSLESYMAYRKCLDNSDTAALEQVSASYTKANGLQMTSGEGDVLIQTTKATGLFKHDTDAHRGQDSDGIRYVRYEYEGVTNAEGHQLRNVILHGVLA